MLYNIDISVLLLCKLKFDSKIYQQSFAKKNIFVKYSFGSW